MPFPEHIFLCHTTSLKFVSSLAMHEILLHMYVIIIYIVYFACFKNVTCFLLRV